MTQDRPNPVEAAQRAYAEHMILVAEFGDLAARAAAIGDRFGASRYHRHAHEHSREAWRALVRWRDQIDQQAGDRSCA
jgi:hypothetical protein